MKELLHKEEVYAIVGAAIAVYNELGAGFLEPVFQEALEMEFSDRHIPSEAQKELPIVYKGRRLKKGYVADFVAFEKVIVEIKALDKLTPREESQVLNYLKASGLEAGVLINFGAQGKLKSQRLVKSKKATTVSH